MRILSLQSWVAYGHVGNAAALFPLQRLGAEVIAVHTTQLSNHKGYPDAPGAATSPETITDIVGGLARRHALFGLDGVLSGYLGESAVATAVLAAVSRAKAASPSCLYCCDPVLGDDGRLYVAADLPDFFRQCALPLADVAVPNAFELSLLTGLSCATLGNAKRALARLQAMGPREVLLSGYHGEGTPENALDMVSLGADGAYFLLRTPRLPIAVNGAGDLLAALYLFHRLALRAAPPALEAAAASLFGLIEKTAKSGQRELDLIAAQDEIVHPTRRFRVSAC